MTFTLTKDHIKLLRAMWVEWEGSMAGAPCVDPKRPYGNGDVNGDVQFILTGEQTDEISDAQVAKYEALHRSTETALQIVLSVGKFVPGRYKKVDEYGKDWKWINPRK